MIVMIHAIKTKHQDVLYLPAGAAYYRYEWEVTDAAAKVVKPKRQLRRNSIRSSILFHRKDELLGHGPCVEPSLFTVVIALTQSIE